MMGCAGESRWSRRGALLADVAPRQRARAMQASVALALEQVTQGRLRLPYEIA